LTAGRYTYWRSIVRYDFIKADISKIEITENISHATLSNKLVAPYVRSYTVESYEKALLFVDGKYVQQLESGVYFWWKNNIAIHVGKVILVSNKLKLMDRKFLPKTRQHCV
jgi:hypothetical protein